MEINLELFALLYIRIHFTILKQAMSSIYYKWPDFSGAITVHEQYRKLEIRRLLAYQNTLRVL